MAEFENSKSKDGFTAKLWRGERMTLLGFDVAVPEPDLVGFAIECKEPGETAFRPLLNRIAFSYPVPAPQAVTGDRLFDSRKAPFQKFRWVHFPPDPRDGTYRYRATKMHMRNDGSLVKGTTLTVSLDLDQVTHAGMVDVGFTRNFASSQAYREQFGNNADIIPGDDEDGLAFSKLDLRNERGINVYDWLAFEAGAHLFDFLDTAIADPAITLDVMAYDLNEPDIVGRLEQMGGRLRAIVDDSSKKVNGVVTGHAAADSMESIAAGRLAATAGAAAVKRTHFSNLQHNKVFIARRNGVPERVLCGSTNFTYRGLYIQANNVVVFHEPQVAQLFARMFELAFANPGGFRADPFAKTWHAVHVAGKPTINVCFSPHTATDLSLNPIRAAIDQATSSVFYSVAFLNQMTTGPTIEAFARLMQRPVFSCGTVDQRGGLELRKPDGSVGLVDFAYLSKKAPEPFKSEWSGGKGRNIHHKFLVTDFSLPSAKVFTGSSNFSPTGEHDNGDHLIMVEDRKIATAYAIEGIRVFDHLQFRNRMRDHFGENDEHLANSTAPPSMTLRKPTAISGKPAWFERYYVQDTQNARDRLLFAS